MAEKLSLDVILLDWDMPEMNGLEVLSKLKEKDETKNIPVIMLTGRSRLSEIENAFDLGADSYITKPVQFHELPETLKRKLKEIKSVAS
jgi:two-component system phosphate regulon response regulator PhoB